MRIIGGRLRGRTVEAPRGVLSRPPLSVIRESIFNILGRSIEGGRVLDLFAGSGSLGIEAVSRGAGEVHFVDSARRCAEMIERNARSLGIGDVSRVTRQDALEFVRAWRGGPFDVIFIDPPFLSGRVDEALQAFDGSGLVSDRTVVVARVHWRERPSVPSVFQIARQRKFGDSVVFFLKIAAQGAAK